MAWTLDDAPSLKGKRVVVTGANAGLGFETARMCAAKGAEVVMACRNQDKARAAAERIEKLNVDATIKLMPLDLASLKSVRAFAADYTKRYETLDLLINNAGIMMCPYARTQDGFESQMGVNHLGHFALTGLLMEPLVKSKHARVVNLSSNGHRLGSMNFRNLLYEDGKGYGPLRAYARSKLANLLFTFELERRLRAQGSTVIALAAHPGGADTNLAPDLQKKWYFQWARPLLLRTLGQSATDGAMPTMRAATDPLLNGADYVGPAGFMEQQGPPVKVKASKAACNEATARQLWERSEKLTNVAY